jgi:hypothetical protein
LELVLLENPLAEDLLEEDHPFDDDPGILLELLPELPLFEPELLLFELLKPPPDDFDEPEKPPVFEYDFADLL